MFVCKCVCCRPGCCFMRPNLQIVDDKRTNQPTNHRTPSVQRCLDFGWTVLENIWNSSCWAVNWYDCWTTAGESCPPCPRAFVKGSPTATNQRHKNDTVEEQKEEVGCKLACKGSRERCRNKARALWNKLTNERAARSQVTLAACSSWT